MAMGKWQGQVNDQLASIQGKLDQLLEMLQPMGVEVGGFIPNDYDDMTAEEIIDMADNWSGAVRDAVMEHEQANKNRKTVVEALSD